MPLTKANGFLPDLSAIPKDVAKKAKLMWMNSPNNPTGSVLPADAVERVLRETRALVVCDEAYQEFGGPTATPLLGRSSRVVVLRTFSKAMGAAGLRFGIGMAQGYATLGRIGFEDRFDYTAIGAVINLAARLCSAADNGQVLMSGRLIDGIEELAKIETLGERELRGMSRPVIVCNLIGLKATASSVV